MKAVRILILSMNSAGYQALADITDPTKWAYADRWGYDYSCIVDEGLSGPRNAWRRVDLWREALNQTDFIFFTGTDAAITNPKISLADRFSLYDTPADLIVSADGNGLQSDAFILRSSPKTKAYLERVLAWEGLCRNEQDAMSIELSGANSYGAFCGRVGNLRQNGEPPSEDLLAKLEVELNKSEIVVKIVPQKLINAYPNQLYGGRIAGGQNQWEHGDFCLHIPGQTNATRIQFLKSIL